MGGTLEKMKGRSDRRVGITNRLDDPTGADRDRSDSDLSDEWADRGGGRGAVGMDGNERRRRRRSNYAWSSRRPSRQRRWLTRTMRTSPSPTLSIALPWRGRQKPLDPLRLHDAS